MAVGVGGREEKEMKKKIENKERVRIEKKKKIATLKTFTLLYHPNKNKERIFKLSDKR